MQDPITVYDLNLTVFIHTQYSIASLICFLYLHMPDYYNIQNTITVIAYLYVLLSLTRRQVGKGSQAYLEVSNGDQSRYQLNNSEGKKQARHQSTHTSVDIPNRKIHAAKR